MGFLHHNLDLGISFQAMQTLFRYLQ